MEPSRPALHADAAGFDAGAVTAQCKPRSRKAAAHLTATAVSAAVAAAAAAVDEIVADQPAPTDRAEMHNADTPVTSMEDEHDVALHGSTDVRVETMHIASAASAPAAANAVTETPTAHEDARMPAEEVYQRIGLLTRTLHDALRELGYDKDLMQTRDHLPDARDRLAYIARVTGEAAEKVLNAVDRARTVQEQLSEQAVSLRTRWQAVAAYTANGAANGAASGAANGAANGARATPAGKQLVDETCEFFAGIGGQASATQAILTDIMMAQDFHDLTGQVIRKVVTLATNMEEQLLKLLIETTPPEQRKKIVETEHLQGPVVNADGRDDVVTDQEGVDDLLASLGF